MSEIEKLNPSLKAGGSANCHRTVCAPCTLSTDRKSPVQVLSGAWRGEAALFDLSNKQGSVWSRWRGGTHSQHQAQLMARSGHGFSKVSPLEDQKGVNLKASETAPNTLQKALNSNSHLNHEKLLFRLCKQRENQQLVGQLEVSGVGQRPGVPSWVPLCVTPTLLSCGVYSQCFGAARVNHGVWCICRADCGCAAV